MKYLKSQVTDKKLSILYERFSVIQSQLNAIMMSIGYLQADLLALGEEDARQKQGPVSAYASYRAQRSPLQKQAKGSAA